MCGFGETIFGKMRIAWLIRERDLHDSSEFQYLSTSKIGSNFVKLLKKKTKTEFFGVCHEQLEFDEPSIDAQEWGNHEQKSNHRKSRSFA